MIRLVEGAGGFDVEATDTGWEDVINLPPLPEPERCEQRSEACCGNVLVLFLISLFVGPMQAFSGSSEAAAAPNKIVWSTDQQP